MTGAVTTDFALLRAQEGEAALQRYRDGLLHAWLSTVGALGFSLVPLFLALDAYTAPRALLPRFALYRGVATGVCLLAFLVTRRTRATRWSFLWGYLISLVVGGSITAMTVELGGFDSRYYAGLNLVIAGVNLFLPWRPLHSAANGLMVIVVYLAANAALGGPFDPGNLAGNVAFMGATVVMAVAITFAKNELIRKEYVSRSELLDMNALLDGSRGELKAARDALWGEMEVAKRIQTALLPRDRRAGQYEVAAAMIPAAEVGGDYYDIVSPPGGPDWIAIGDVSGHGVESGLVMMMTQTAIQSLVRREPTLRPAEVFTGVNDAICENVARLGSNRYMTLNVVRLDDGGLTLAGKHQDVLVWRAGSGRVETFGNEGCWIGVVRDVSASAIDAFLPLSPGDVALFFTDGVTEARDPSGEQFGEGRLGEAFARVAAGPPAEAIRAILGEIARFTRDPGDDVTLLVLRRDR